MVIRNGIRIRNSHRQDKSSKELSQIRTRIEKIEKILSEVE